MQAGQQGSACIQLCELAVRWRRPGYRSQVALTCVALDDKLPFRCCSDQLCGKVLTQGADDAGEFRGLITYENLAVQDRALTV